MHAALLGPQRLQPTLAEEVQRLSVDGPVATVTAGWLDREGEDDALVAALGLEVRPLELWRRAEAVRVVTPAWADADRRLREAVGDLRRLYRRRLDHAINAAREMLQATGDAETVLPERRDALATVQRLDRHFVARLGELSADHFERSGDLDPWRRQRDEVIELLAPCPAVAIAGGHVVELIYLLRLFGLLTPLADRTLIAWSAGAMALTDTVVGFHDRPPQGAGNAEVLDRGLGLCRGVVLLPDARKRLNLDDPHRVALMARRFEPAHCVTLDPGARLGGEGRDWTGAGGAMRLEADGNLRPAEALAPWPEDER